MQSYGLSHKGYIRKVNQDAFFHQDTAIGPLSNLYVLADGMGGHRGGEVASKLAVDTIIQSIQKAKDFMEPAQILEQAISDANQRIFNEAIEDSTLYNMGTTVIASCMIDRKIYVAHVGDSRFYVYINNRLEQITKDHSYVQELVDVGAITAEEAKHHPQKNQITRAVGINATIQVDIYTIDLDTIENVIEYILICTDGLTNMVSELEIMQVIKEQKSNRDICEKLIEDALSAGGTDNITCIIIQNN